MDAMDNSNSPEIGSVEEVDGYGDVLAQATKPTLGCPELMGIQDFRSDNEYVLLQTQASFDSRKPPLGSVQNVATSLSSLDQLGQKHGPGSFSRGCLVRHFLMISNLNNSAVLRLSAPYLKETKYIHRKEILLVETSDVFIYCATPVAGYIRRSSIPALSTKPPYSGNL
jgi:hypothetical protein